VDQDAVSEVCFAAQMIVMAKAQRQEPVWADAA
jgi:hypothetical protein